MKRFEVTPTALTELKELYALRVRDLKRAEQALSDNPSEANGFVLREAITRLNDLKKVIAILEIPVGEQLIIQRGF